MRFRIHVSLVTALASCFAISGAWVTRAAFAGGDTLLVDPAGRGQYTTIQAALNSVSGGRDNSVVILLRNGLYREKIFITRSRVSIFGEDRDSTTIVYPELRENWNRDHCGSDWGAGVVNIDTGVTDVTLANMTVYNNYGSLYNVFNKHQFTIRGAGTRIMLLQCTVKSDGGDAVSLWNREDGMYYHSDCRFEGWVDFVCPRGWCYVTRSTFFGHNTPSASIWHDGSANRAQKFVIRDSYFDGVPGFPLGRNHLDAQFYLVNCRFSRHMADRPFFRPPSSPREWQWGARHYFYSCHRDSADFNWFKDNLSSAEGNPEPKEINAKWAFDGRWDPEATLPLMPTVFKAQYLGSTTTQ
jgi:pectinesterase